ncbi:MAG: DNA recombination protein RmuC, partial [Pricia sp.]
MNENVLYLLIGFVCMVIGYLLGNYIRSLKTKSTQSALEERERQLNQTLTTINQRLVDSEAHKVQLQSEKEKLGNQIVRYQADLENLHDKNRAQKQEVEKLQEKFTLEFENLANKILEEKTLKFTERNEKNIKNILTPLNEKILLFEKKVDESRKENFGIHQALREQLLNLQTQNLKITQEAENLTKALKGDSKMQGNWGELVLERVLEKSGLEKGREYSVQQSFQRDGGSRVLPDVIINLPDGKKMVIDSKVSLVAYERMVNAEDELQDRFLKEHIASLRKHVDQLSAKKYEDLYAMESPDFVLMFVPIEPAFAVALN